MASTPPMGTPAGDAPLQIKARRSESELARLNERIARLALSLGVPLDTPADLQRLLDHASSLFDPDPQHWPQASDGQKRLRHELEELRGLLVMRCDLMTHLLNDLGLDVAFQISAEVEEWLQRQGFKPGADGFVLLRQLQARDALNQHQNTP